MSSGQPYAPVDGHDSSYEHDGSHQLSPPSHAPHLGEMDLGRMSFFEQQQQQRSHSPQMYLAQAPPSLQQQSNIGPSSHHSSPLLRSPSPAGSQGFSHLFSSAQAYTPVGGAEGLRPPTPGTPGTTNEMLRSSSARPPWLSSRYSDRGSSYRNSIGSSHMLAHSDVGSQQQLTRYDDTADIPLHAYEKSGDARYMAIGGAGAAAGAGEKYGDGRPGRFSTPMSKRKKWGLFAAVVVALMLIALAVAIPLVVNYDRQHANDNANSGQGTALVPGTGPGGQVLTSGKNGTQIRMDNGTTFTYINNFGGEWRSGLSDNGARAQNYTPAMNEDWDYGKDAIMGVNLGGWLVLEPFIVPSFFEPYENNTGSGIVDEYTLMMQWENEGGQAKKESNMRQHYDTFITEYDFMMIAAAGLNWVRIPIGYWAIDTMPGEPFVSGMAWEYFLKAVQWARKYGLRINVDLHAIPGSQNGYNHGGRLGVFNFLNSPSGMVSAQRALDTIRVITEFISQPDVKNVVPLFGILNEPNLPIGIGMDNLRNFYVEVYNMIREIGGNGAGNGPIISFHDGFMTLNNWNQFMTGADRVAWDLHPYVCFVAPFYGRDNLAPAACNGFAANEEQGLNNFGITMAGEWSLAPNDCGLYLNGPYQGIRYDGTFSDGTYTKTGDCGPFDDWQNYSNATKTQMYQGAIAQMASFRNFFFWTWKIGNSLRTGGPVNPNWNYLLGLEQGWMPKDPYNESRNACANLQQQGVQGITKTSLNWDNSFSDWQTGGAKTYAPNTAAYTWPPASMMSSGTMSSMPASLLPTYTSTGAVLIPPTPTLSVSFSQEATPSLDPWVQGGRQTPAFTPIKGCSYFDSIWNNATTVEPGWPCQGGNSGSRRKRGLDAAMVDDVFMDWGLSYDDEEALFNVRRAPPLPKMTAAPLI